MALRGVDAGCDAKRDDPLGQSPIDEQRADLVHAEVALLAIALAHDVQQDRPFAFHQQPVVPTPFALGAR
jgi:hypothetical protein